MGCFANPPYSLPNTITDIAWAAQTRLCARYRRLAARRLLRTKIIVAIARELVGFTWAIARAVPLPTQTATATATLR